MTMIPSALDLFLKYTSEVRVQVHMIAANFGMELGRQKRFYLHPFRATESIAPKDMLEYPHIDLERAGIRPLIAIDPESGTDPRVQVVVAYKRAVEKYLEGRRFYLRLCRDPRVFPRYYNVPLPEVQLFPVEFYTTPAIPRALVINPEGQARRHYLHWSHFVPIGTLQHNAIQAALDVGEAMRQSLKPSAEELAQMHAKVHNAVALVGA